MGAQFGWKWAELAVLFSKQLPNGPTYIFHIFRIFFLDYLKKNPQTTNARTFLSLIILSLACVIRSNNECYEMCNNWGIVSIFFRLVAMAPLYDTGAGSTYDLRHFTMGGPPKLARWDYHSTHINLLYVLSTIVPEKNNRSMLQALADRWQSYMVSNPRSVFF